MRILLKNADAYYGGRYQKKDVLIDGRRIADVQDTIDAPADRTEDLSGYHLIPGFIDIHSHGGDNVDVNHATREDFHTLSRFYAANGTTAWQCSILTDTEENTFRTIREACAFMDEEAEGAELIGIHLEGPFLSTEYKGSMPEYLLKKEMDMDLLKRYQEAAGGRIRYITVSPEVPGVVEAIPEIRRLGIHVAIGHSGADYDTSMRTIANGAEACTHTFNAMKLFHQHFPAIMGAVLESDVCCEAICDGRHLHPASVRFLLKTKGYDHVAAITDSIMAAGLPDGNYKLGVNDVIVKDHDAKLKDGTRAGSTLTTEQAFYNIMKFTDGSSKDVVRLLSENPARLVGVEADRGFIRPGNIADLHVTDANDRIVHTMAHGVVVK